MVTPEEVGMSSERLARIRPVMEKHVGDGKMAGVLTLLARRGVAKLSIKPVSA